MRFKLGCCTAALLLLATVAVAATYEETISLFKNAGQSAAFFHTCYGYAVFPTIGKGGLVVGGGYGKGRVYVHGRYVGDTSLTQVSVGWQVGGQAYSQIIFFENKAIFDEFAQGDFEFGADADAVAITAAAGASASTAGASAGASGGMKDAVTAGRYYKGMAVFTIVKGGAMAQAALAGQKFSYTPKAAS
ncbi:MAG TPA: YSC84-related protein [Steroidobacteraceae bacterium]|nr:YSC84-related protein [Steroidobacteraceae bacterium]